MKVDAATAQKLWYHATCRSVPGEYNFGYMFSKTQAEIEEWTRRGKWSKLKDYCLQLPYEVKMACLAPDEPKHAKKFMFFFQTKEDVNRFENLHNQLKVLRNCRKVVAIEFDEVPAEDLVEGYGWWGVCNDASCPLVI